MRGTASVIPLTYANIETADPTRIIVRPAGPSATAAAEASGVGSFASASPSSPCATTWIVTYSTATTRHGEEDRARHRARRIAHLAARHQRALDAEEGEDEQHRRARHRAPRSASPCQARFDQRIATRPTTHEQQERQQLRDRGDRVEARHACPRRARSPPPGRPARRRSATRRPVAPSAGTSASSESAKKVAHRGQRQRDRRPRAAPRTTNPTNGPNAVSTYAYGPPVIDTRLPASAKQSTMSPMTSVHARYASGAAAPNAAATPGRQPEDPAAHRHVHDPRREPPRADHAGETALADALGRDAASLTAAAARERWNSASAFHVGSAGRVGDPTREAIDDLRHLHRAAEVEVGAILVRRLMVAVRRRSPRTAAVPTPSDGRR